MNDAVLIEVDYQGKLAFRGTNRNGTSLVLDGGSGEAGLKPTELLLAALGACSGIDVVEIMRKKRQPLSHYRIEIEGHRADSHPRRFQSITVRHVGCGPGVTEEALRQAALLSHERYCSVGASLNSEVEVEVRVVTTWPDPVRADAL
jgi:putative redox protein